MSVEAIPLMPRVDLPPMPSYPVEPLAEALRRAIAAEPVVSMSEGIERVARGFARRFGGAEASARRQVWRLLRAHRTARVRAVTADRWATFLGLHLDLLYRDVEGMGHRSP